MRAVLTFFRGFHFLLEPVITLRYRLNKPYWLHLLSSPSPNSSLCLLKLTKNTPRAGLGDRNGALTIVGVDPFCYESFYVPQVRQSAAVPPSEQCIVAFWYKILFAPNWTTLGRFGQVFSACQGKLRAMSRATPDETQRSREAGGGRVSSRSRASEWQQRQGSESARLRRVS